MRASELLLSGERALGRSDSARLDAELLLSHVLQTNRAGLYARMTEHLAPNVPPLFQRLIRLRAKGVPVAYLTGQQDTPIGQLRVDPRVLIPRPSTELLIQAVTRVLRGRTGVAADIGTGSGVIAISLAKALPAFQIEASDISPAALEVARHNALVHGVEDRITWRYGSLLQPWAQRLEPDAVIANLPYLPTAQAAAAQVRYEPPLALHGGRDGLQLLARFTHQLHYHPLVQVVAFECQPDQVDTLAYWLRLVRPRGFRVAPIQDGAVSWGVIGERDEPG